MERKGRTFVHGFAEYNMMANELDELLSRPLVAVPRISPNYSIGRFEEREFVLKLRGLLPAAVPHLDEKMLTELTSYSYSDEFQLIKNQSIPFSRGGISAIAYWPRVKFGFHDVETGRSRSMTSEYRLRQIDAITYGYSLVDHMDQDHMFYDTFSAAERFAKEHGKGFWGLSAEDQKRADSDRKKQTILHSEIWKFLEGLEWETLSVESSKMKRIWTIGTRDEDSLALLSFDSEGQTLEDRYDVEVRGVLLTGNKKLDLQAQSLLARRRGHYYLLEDSIESVSGQKIRGIVYHTTYSLTEEREQKIGRLPVDTYRTWQPLAVALGYCLVDHNDRAHPLYETLVKAESLAKRLEMGYWGLDADDKLGK
jgi:hypothetical protein